MKPAIYQRLGRAFPWQGYELEGSIISVQQLIMVQIKSGRPQPAGYRDEVTF